MLMAHKVELRPTKSQAEYLNKCIGHSRNIYNNLLRHFSQDGVKWSKKEARIKFMELRATECQYYDEISADFLRESINNLDNAYKHFFRRVKSGESKTGYPTKRKLGVHDVCALRDRKKFSVSDDGLRFEKFNKRKKQSPIKLREKLRFTGTVKQMNISKRAGKYFCSFLVETEDYNPKDNDRHTSVGVDFGIKDLAICSNGKKFGANQKLKASLNRLGRKQRRLAKQVKGSNRRAKTKQAIQKLHKRIADQRAATLHEVSDYLTSNFDRIVIEDLNVSGMMKNGKVSRAVADCGLYELRRQLEYKSQWRNCELIIADRWFASTKTCSHCGYKNSDVVLGVDSWECPECLTTHDRDLNAAINLDNYQIAA
ncbi:RNA-guided endonuclease InsQ/TnpB family protein [Vibrio agarivorans]|uniref:RNA-guided endonuclease TnpB family protein n=1 Tax=Vibrio agarivorans TaxID=153622 RepID=A0ABT7Y764_9VIBR|nr:RNA-guided endonuclease TnpB family protein [Vibrio agarivorans]MDN2483892.1 RNA-guided endonuclease TnpB family protein [Vibrio agarivorans]